MRKLRHGEAKSMKTSELIFIGIKGSVVALSRLTGQQAWATQLKGYDFVNVTFEDEQVFATSRGEVFCLDPLSGNVLWHNPLKGYGLGLATIAIPGSASTQAQVIAEHRRRAEQSAASSSAA